MGMILSIAAGGALGSTARYLLSGLITNLVGPGFPWGILVVLGCFVMGIIAELGALSWNMTPEMRAFLATGILGGFTTFSAFALDVAVLGERGDTMVAFGYVAASVLGSVAALFLGLALVRVLAS